jgi:predicted metal-dependent phosphoesterase TrpH
MIDLHLHSHFSDGTWSPEELVEHAVKIGMKHIALSDHDTVDGIDEAIAAAAGRVEIIPAVEINTIEAGNNVHILGYFIDHHTNELDAVLAKQKAARHKHMLGRIASIQESGIKLTLEGVQACAGGAIGVLGTAHITEAIVQAGGAADLTEAWEKYLQRGSPYYVERQSVRPHEAIMAIRAAGGIPSMAHPGKESYVIPLIESLTRVGLMAVEAYHQVHSDELTNSYIEYAASRGLLVTGGSDCHGPYREFESTMGSIKVPEDVLTNLRKNSCS